MLRLAIILSVVGAVASQQRLSDSDVERAIQAGANKNHNDLISTCGATPYVRGDVSADPAGGRSSLGTFHAVTGFPGDDLRGPAIFVHVEPDKPRLRLDDHEYDVAAVIDAVVLESKSDPSKVLHPVSSTTERVEWGRLLGRTVTGNRATATFDYTAVRSLPPGDFEVVVITSPGERRCKVGRGDREKLFRAGE